MSRVTLKGTATFAIGATAIFAALASAPLPAKAQTFDFTGNSYAILLEPIVSGEGNTISNDLGQNFCGSPAKEFGLGNATVDAFRKMGDGYGIVYANSHGDVDYNLGFELLTGEQYNSSPLIGSPDEIAHKIVKRYPPGSTTPYWAITPTFVKSYATTYDYPIVYIDACWSAVDSDSMGAAFIGVGAGAYFGYNNLSDPSSGPAIGDQLFYNSQKNTGLANVSQDLTLGLQNRATQKSYENSGGTATLVMGDGSDPNLVISGGIANGGFEDSDQYNNHLVGWKAGFTNAGTEAAGGGPFPGPFYIRSMGLRPCNRHSLPALRACPRPGHSRRCRNARGS